MMTKKQEFFFTQEGLDNLGKELQDLKGSARVELAKRLRVAIQQGDLSENADYSKAKEDQAFLEGRIQEIQIMLSSAVLIEEGENKGLIGVGSTLTIQEKGRDPIEYFMVGAQEADPRNGRISNESPIGKALLGHAVGDLVDVETPGGTIVFEIIKVK